MKHNSSSRSIVCRYFIAGLLGLSLAAPTLAENVFQASLSTAGDTAQLQFGKFYLRVESSEVDFMAVIFPLGTLTDNLNPLLTVPGDALGFTLGTGTRNWLSGTHTVADQNPFLPAPPWLPSGFDEAGNPFYIDSTVIRLADIYTGHFTLPDGFGDDLLAGLGRIQFGEALGGDLLIATVPEPTTSALLVLAGLSWCCRRKD